MITPEFSEFSYGYTITDNILHSGFASTGAAPEFPSLQAEGSVGGGYDVKIPLFPVPIFLQFKVPQIVTRRSIKCPATFLPPYYRMHLRTKDPNQHQLLCDLEAKGNLVFYAAPAFDTDEDLDDHFKAGIVHEKSIFVRPKSIGALDDSPHCIAYQSGSEIGWLCSNPAKLAEPIAPQAFNRIRRKAIEEASRQERLAFLRNLVNQILEISGDGFRRTEFELAMPDKVLPDYQIPPPKIKNTPSGASRDAGGQRDHVERREAVRLWRRASYLSRVRLGCSLFIAGREK